MSRLPKIRQVTVVLLWLALSLLPSLLAEDALWLNWSNRLFLVGMVVLLAYLVESNRRQLFLFLLLLGIWSFSMVVYPHFESWPAAWLLVVTWFTFLLVLGRQLRLTTFKRSYLRWPWHLIVWAGTALAAGSGLAVFSATLSHFAEEEFFIVSTGALLSLFWLLLALGYQLLRAAPKPLFPSLTRSKWTVPVTFASVVFMGIIGVPGLLNQYQRSFFPLTAPTYAGISAEAPFVCEELSEQPQPIRAKEIERTLLSLLEANTNKNTLAWGSLAIYTGDIAYAAEFRRHLLQEAAENRYTSPAHSIKWGQYEAALRIQQLVLIDDAFPELFSAEDWQTFSSWFSAINQRAMTVEWVDWLYAAAYGKRPEGPYENQEIGAGLLAALMSSGLAAADLTQLNTDYLDRTPLGWEALFRNTDDSYFYQDIWLANAWWIHRYRQLTGEDSDTAQRNIELSVLWLLVLSLPDGESLSYNLQVEPSMASAYLFGAAMADSPQMSWVAGKTLRRFAEKGGVLFGNSILADLPLPDGEKPTVGTCLVFGNSGVPTAEGPLGPDKVVFRDGWSDNAAYALLNLRFTGWHRYKATNTIPLIYQQGPLVSERWTSENFWWLPAGRSAFRDKRVPREYLNGLLLPKTGLPELLRRITAVGSPWSQDPPAYAEVDTFFTSDSIDMSTTHIQNWHGWQHERTIYFISDGLVLVVDHAAADNPSQPASLIWHVNGRGQRQTDGLTLTNEHRPAKIAWPADDDAQIAMRPLPAGDAYLHSPEWELLYTSPLNNKLKTAITFLTGAHTEGAFETTYVGDGTDKRQGMLANWSANGRTVSLLHNFTDGDLETDTLRTDGTMLTRIQDESETRLCYAGGETIHARLPDSQQPQAITAGSSRLAPSSWQFTGGWLTITITDRAETGCLQLHD